jgi:hypothetical protein
MAGTKSPLGKVMKPCFLYDEGKRDKSTNLR